MTQPRLIAAYQRPSLDTLVALWMAERYLCLGEPTEIAFVRAYPRAERHRLAWFAQPRLLPTIIPNLFAHGARRKRPSFADRYAASATGTIWTELLDKGRPVAHLVDLVNAVHGDARPVGETSGTVPQEAVRASLLRTYERASRRATDLGLYRIMRDWFDEYEASLGLNAVVAVNWDQVASSFPRDRGTYVVILETAAPGSVLIGRTGSLGRMEVVPGYYAYIGSAGRRKLGVRGRQEWHLTLAQELKLKWQVDFLKLRCSVSEVWFTTDPLPPPPFDLDTLLDRECALAECVLHMPGASIPVAKFGSTKCYRRCDAHLAYFGSRPSFRAAQAATRHLPDPFKLQRVVVG